MYLFKNNRDHIQVRINYLLITILGKCLRSPLPYMPAHLKAHTLRFLPLGNMELLAVNTVCSAIDLDQL